MYSLSGGPYAPFENTWHLREDYKKVSKRKELAEGLRKRIAIAAFINLILSPVIFLWQILYSFFNYAEVSDSGFNLGKYHISYSTGQYHLEV